MSGYLTPIARASITTSPGPGTGSGRVSTPCAAARPCSRTTTARTLAGLFHEAAPDQLAMDLVGAFPDLCDLGVAHQALDAVVLAVAVAAVQLHRLGGDAHRQVRGAQLGDRSFDADVARARVDQARHVPQPGLALRELGGEVREQELDALEFDDAPPRLAPLIDVVDCVAEGRARDSQGMCRDARARLVQRGEQQLQAFARRGEQVRARHAATVEGE